jgi:hypothetical protein
MPMMDDADQRGDFTTEWVRRRYVVVGDLIRPVPGATSERYNPFDSANQRPVYLELAGLDAVNGNAVEAFVSPWGLLGLFFHPILTIELGSEEAAGGSQLYTVHDFLRTDSTDLVSEQLRRDPGAQGSVVVWDEVRRKHTRVGLEAHSRSYFPDLQDRWGAGTRNKGFGPHAMTVLASADRWDYLCEPLSGFRNAVAEFRSAFADCVRWSGGDRSVSLLLKLQGRFEAHLRQVHPSLSYILEPAPRSAELRSEPPSPLTISPQLAEPVPPGDLSIGWTYPSLLSAAYASLFRDLVHGRRLQYCANETCGKPMVADHAARIYCSERCLNTTRHRAYRNRRRTRPTESTEQ